jgi:hypothetical protein
MIPGSRHERAPRAPMLMPLHPRPIRRPLPAAFAALLVVAAFGAPIALAQKRQGTFGKAPPGSSLLRGAELRECLQRQTRIHAATEETTRQQAQLRADRTEIDRLGSVLKEQAETLDRKASEAVGAYNAQVQTRDELIDRYQNSVPAFNAKVEALKADQEAFAKACEGRRYDEDEAAAIKKSL